MSEAELLRRGSVTKQMLVQALTDLRNDREKNKAEDRNLVAELEESLTRKLEPVLHRMTQITESVQDLKNEVANLKQNYHDLITSNSLEAEALIREATERFRRQKYLVISGIPEQTTGSIEERRTEDTNAIKELGDALLIEKLEPKEATRIGKLSLGRPRLLRFKCSDKTTRIALLKKSKQLKSQPGYQNIFINPDLTKLQRDTAKELRDELKLRRARGENVVIRNGKISDARQTENFL